MSIIKTYKSPSSIGISVLLPSGKSKRVTFDALYDGSSSYSTDDENLQKAMESDYRFGKMFRLESAVDDSIVPVAEDDADDAIEQEEECAEVNVSTLSEAREYLALKFEIQRGKIRSRDDIAKCAEQHGVKFVGIDL